MGDRQEPVPDELVDEKTKNKQDKGCITNELVATAQGPLRLLRGAENNSELYYRCSEEPEFESQLPTTC